MGDEDLEARFREQVGRIEAAASSFAQVLAHVSYEQGNVSWPREIILARQKIDEALMWALKGVGKVRLP
jgi:hypothetical protein